ncbi:DUF5825 family protein [Streptomyces sp. SID14478]|uniref:DUF5825 family protein n=1 Tax=Streptomyces sp. SID14478 TaxID=2706073 RepID=UPI00194426ED|nr:DUF5825 family protein [Streptomyces sp. SID14478]
MTARRAAHSAVLPDTVAHRMTGTDRTHVRVSEPLLLRGDGRRTTQAVQFLRECLGHGLRVTYDVDPVTYDVGPATRDVGRVTYDVEPVTRGVGPVTCDGERHTYDLAAPEAPDAPDALRALRHLPPPAPHADEPAEWTSWRDDHAVGMLYQRRGPGFVTVMDRRERPRSARFTLDHPDLLAAFDALQEATPLDALDAVHREGAALLAGERLALIVDGWAVALPARLRRWPVPCTGI